MLWPRGLCHHRLRRLTIPLLLLLVVAVGWAWYLYEPSHLDPDSDRYLHNAATLAAGKGMLDESGAPDTLRTPGYPAALALLGRINPSVGAIVAAQVALNALICVAIYLLLLPALGHRTAVTSAVIYALYLPSVMIANEVMTETLFTAVLLATVVTALAAARRGSIPLAALAGVLGGVSFLVRPIALFGFIPLGVFLAVWASRRRVALVLIFVAFYAVLPAAWAKRNQRVSGVLTATSMSGQQLLLWKAAGTLVVHKHGFLWGLSSLQAENGFFLEFRRTQPLLEKEAAADLRRKLGDGADRAPFAVRAQEWSRRGIRLLMKHPLDFAALAASGFVHMWIDGYWEIPARKFYFDVRTWASSFFLLGVAVLCVAVRGFRELVRCDRLMGVLFASVFVFFTILSVGPEAGHRFSTPLAPYYAAAIGTGLVYYLGVIERRLSNRPSESA